MAESIIIHTSSPDETVYIVIRNSTGHVWNGSSFVDFADADLDHYAITTTEQGTSSGTYEVAFPAAITTVDTYDIAAFILLGSTPATTDTLIDAGPYAYSSEPSELVASSDLLTATKAHLKVEDTNDDSLIQGLILAAIAYIECATNQVYYTATRTKYLDEFPIDGQIILYPVPLQSVTSITYLDGDNTSQTFAATNYTVLTTTPGRIVLKTDCDWPATNHQPKNITITYVVGYGNSAQVPTILRLGIYFLVAHWYRNRESVSEQQLKEVPQSIYNIISLNNYPEAI